ncbi:hypothetical protein EDB85DRAFT_1839396, partial [Lactarius pseudohatsudake]
THLTDKYPYAYSDFYPSYTPCVFKSGPDWPVCKGLLGQGVKCEAHLVYGHTIGHNWLSIGTHIYKYLNSTSVERTFIDPLTYANA